jgi:cation:H+ antiporter
MFEEFLTGGVSTTGLIIELIACGALVIFAGGRMAGMGDKLAAITGLGRTWVGAIILGGVTSLPELVVTIGAVTVVNAPALVFGNVLGSNCFNLLIIIFLDITLVGGAVLARGGKTHILSALLGLLIMLVVGAGLLLGQNDALLGGAPWVFSALIAILFLVAMRVMYTREKKIAASAEPDPDGLRLTPAEKRNTLIVFSIFAAIIVGAGLWLSVLGDSLGEHEFPGGFQLGRTFVGFLFIALATSLPELSVSISAARRGFYDMALGNIFGSNIANISFIFVGEIFLKTRDGVYMFSSVPKPAALLVTVGAACLMTLIAMIGIIGRSKRTLLRLGYCSLAMLLTYIVSTYLVFTLSSS